MPPNTSGLRRGGPGRPKGVPNKATAALKELAEPYAPEAIQTLVAIMRDTNAPHAARKGAADSILDRWAGKPAQAITDADGGNLPSVPAVVNFMLSQIPGAVNQT